MMKIKKDDKVLIVSGKDKNKTGKVIKVLPRFGKLVVEGVNIRKKHIRPKKEGQKGQVIERSMPMDVSNMKIICKQCEKAVRIGSKILKDKKIRICKKCQALI